MNTANRIALAAAAILVVAVVGFTLLQQTQPSGQGPSATQTMSATPRPSQSQSPIATSIPTAVTVPDLAAQGSEPLRPGPYAITSISPLRITFSVPADWGTYGGVPATVWVRPGGPSLVAVSFRIVGDVYIPCDGAQDSTGTGIAAGSSVDDLAEALAGAPGLVHNSTTALMLSGFSGKLVDLTCSAEPGLQSDSKVYILDVRGTRLVIQVDEGSRSNLQHQEEAQAIVYSTLIEIR